MVDMMRKANDGLEKMSNKFSSLERGSSGDEEMMTPVDIPDLPASPKKTALKLMDQFMTEVRSKMDRRSPKVEEKSKTTDKKSVSPHAI